MVALTKTPRSPSAIFGSQASLAWEFIDDSIILAQAVKAVITIVVEGTVFGTVTINGVIFTVDNTTPHTATTFANGATNTETVRNLADAIRANQLTANLFNISILTQALSNNGSVTLKAKDVGVVLKTTESDLSGATFSLIQGVTPDIQKRTYYIFQGFTIDSFGNEVAVTTAKTLPPGFNYNTGLQQPVLISLHEAVQSQVKLSFPSIFNPTSVLLDYSPIRLCYIRYGTITYDGCDIIDQNIKISPKVVALAQSVDYTHKNGVSLFVPSGSHQANTKLMSIGAEIGLSLHAKQHGWVSCFWNISVFRVYAQPAYVYQFYNSSNSHFASSSVFLATKPTLGAQIQVGILTVPCGYDNIPYAIPSGTKYIEVLVGSYKDGVFTRNYAPYKYPIIDTSCIEAEVYWKSSYGGWESLAFDKIVTRSISKNTNTYFRDNETRVFAGKGNKDYKEWVEWLDDYGDAELTTARKTLVLETSFLDYTEQSQKYFQQFIASPDKRLKIESGKDGQNYWVAAVRVLTKTNDFTLKPESGLVRYQVELEISSHVDFMQ